MQPECAAAVDAEGRHTVPRSAPTMSTSCPEPDGSSPRTRSFDAPPPFCIDRTARYSAVIDTSVGAMVVALDPRGAPNTVNNFVVLARYHFYDGLTFHRIIKGFMCQGGCPEGTGTGGPGYTFADELPKRGRYEIGSIAMANAGPDTNGSQFFLVSGPKGVALPPQYSLFGKVVRGLEVLEALQSVPTGAGGAPVEPVTITSITIEERA
ncbi:MAG: peptidylprolyl isomerase [Acidimicrobiia bacterium]